MNVAPSDLDIVSRPQLMHQTSSADPLASQESIFKAVEQRKQEQHTDEFSKRYGKRAGIEGTISQGVFAMGMRRSCYRGQDKTHLQFIFTAAAMNITRAINWLNEIPRKT